MRVRRLIQVALTCAALLAPGCDGALHPPDVPLGEAFPVDGVIEAPASDALPAGELRPTLVWTDGLELSDASVLSTVELFFPHRFRISVHGRPPERVLRYHETSSVRWASARVLLYEDVSQTRSFRPDRDPVVGSHSTFLLYVDKDTRVEGGAMLSRGHHLVEEGTCEGGAWLRVRRASEPPLTLRVQPEEPLVEIDLRLACAEE